MVGILADVVCGRCGRASADGDQYCGGCGAALSPECRYCGRSLPAAVTYCTGCGAPRTDDLPEAFTEDRRRVSVLFVDLVEFTSYAERADPEMVRELQIRFYATARRVVRQYGGVVEKYVGDAVMALFGAPVATETDVVRCVRAALELQRALPEAMGGPDRPGFRIGVATGEALVDLAAARDGGQAIVAGDVVTTAARLQAAAPEGGVLVCGTTRALTADTIRYRPQPPVLLRGRRTPTEVWLALGADTRPPAPPDDTPLFDREHEMSLLAGSLRRTVASRTPQLVTLFGQAGIGKSRLVRELRRVAGQLGEPVTWHTGQCRPFGENVTYAALADIVAAEAGILDTDPEPVARQRLMEAARRVVPDADADQLARALGPLVGLPGAGLPAGEAESAWRRFLVGVARRGPTVLVFEDLHWADEPMLRFIELLAATTPADVPLLVLATARPEVVERNASWAGTIAGSVTVTLSPLADSGIIALYRHLFGHDTDPQLLAPLVELAGGNPLYAREYVRMLLQRGTSPATDDGWPPADLPTPDSVHAVIANRLDLLDPADRSVLQAAAVIGDRFWSGAVAATLGHPREAVEHALHRLEQREFVVQEPESSVAGETEFRFRHILVRDVCYQRLPRAERVARHERAAVWLEALARRDGSDTSGQATEVLAHHRWAAHEIARTLGVATPARAAAARAALHLAARRAYALHALDTAAGYTERALSLCSDAELGERLRLELLAAEIAFHRDRSTFLAEGGEARLAALAERLSVDGDPADQARAWTLLGQAAWLRADRPTALAHLERAAALFDPLPDSPEKVDAYAELGRLHMLDYDRDPAIAAAETAAAIAGRLGLLEAQANARITTATARFYAGEKDAMDELTEVVELCRRRGLLALRRAVRNLASAFQEEGDWRRSEALLAEELADEVQGGHTLATGYTAEAMRAYFHGDFDALARAADAFVATPGWQWGDIRLPRLRACVRILRREPTPPQEADALAIARASGFRRPLWTALAWEALTLALQQQHERATGLLAELVDSWRPVPVLASGEWVCAAAYAAALSGPVPAQLLRDALAAQPRQTRWSSAALHTVTGAVLIADNPRSAGDEHLAAATLHGDIPAVTDRMLSLALAADAYRRAGDTERAAPVLAEVRAFAERAGAPGLLELAHPGPTG